MTLLVPSPHNVTLAHDPMTQRTVRDPLHSEAGGWWGKAGGVGGGGGVGGWVGVPLFVVLFVCW